MQSLSFPMRLHENGLLARGDRTASMIALLQMMARTPAGSWAACPAFGLRDLFESARQRADVPRLAALRINETFADLGIETYIVTQIVREITPGRDSDTYSVTLENADEGEVITAVVAHEQ